MQLHFRGWQTPRCGRYGEGSHTPWQGLCGSLGLTWFLSVYFTPWEVGVHRFLNVQGTPTFPLSLLPFRLHSVFRNYS